MSRLHILGQWGTLKYILKFYKKSQRNLIPLEPGFEKKLFSWATLMPLLGDLLSPVQSEWKLLFWPVQMLYGLTNIKGVCIRVGRC